MSASESRFRDTRNAFDLAAADYDGPAGNNAIIQQMRRQVWNSIVKTFSPGARLLDLGCGTGIDLAELATRGYKVVGVDWSPSMVARTRSRIVQRGLGDECSALVVGLQELSSLRAGPFDGAYSNFGPLNCVEDLPRFGRDCASLLRPCGKLVVSVIGRVCPWEILYYAGHFDHRNAFRRAVDGLVPVSLNHEVVWTRYYTPREFANQLDRSFRVDSYRALGLFEPPPYLLHLERRLGRLGSLLRWLDRRLAHRPVLRDVGDHFLMVLSQRDNEDEQS